jgi:8-oxo-dGTP pyrophosphatase MutT (NUDIX family)
MRALLRFLYTLEVPRLGGAPVQAGAICWREGAMGLEILLVTSRRSGKWGVPKGWALRGRSLHKTAEREAWEEAGVVGRTENLMLGPVDAPKRYRLAGTIDWTLALYALQVERLAESWPERRQRQRRWFPQAEAAERVRPRSLQPLLADFHPTSASEGQGQQR